MYWIISLMGVSIAAAFVIIVVLQLRLVQARNDNRMLKLRVSAGRDAHAGVVKQLDIVKQQLEATKLRLRMAESRLPPAPVERAANDSRTGGRDGIEPPLHVGGFAVTQVPFPTTQQFPEGGFAATRPMPVRK